MLCICGVVNVIYREVYVCFMIMRKLVLFFIGWYLRLIMMVMLVVICVLIRNLLRLWKLFCCCIWFLIVLIFLVFLFVCWILLLVVMVFMFWILVVFWCLIVLVCCVVLMVILWYLMVLIFCWILRWSRIVIISVCKLFIILLCWLSWCIGRFLWVNWIILCVMLFVVNGKKFVGFRSELWIWNFRFWWWWFSVLLCVFVNLMCSCRMMICRMLLNLNSCWLVMILLLMIWRMFMSKFWVNIVVCCFMIGWLKSWYFDGLWVGYCFFVCFSVCREMIDGFWLVWWYYYLWYCSVLWLV